MWSISFSRFLAVRSSDFFFSIDLKMDTVTINFLRLDDSHVVDHLQEELMEFC